MVTYSHPHTFCYIFCMEVKLRKWKIQTKPFFDQIVMGLPDGLSVHAPTGREAMILLAERFMEKYHLEYSYDKNLGEDTKYHYTSTPFSSNFTFL